MNINTAEYWDSVYENEILENNLWRNYPYTFKKIVEMIKKERITSKKEFKVLELGCGVGILAMEMEKYADCVGVDISRVAIEKYFQNVKKSIGIVDKVPPINFKTNFFKIVVASEFLEHFEYPEEVIKEASRVGEIGIFAVPNNCLKPEECKEHYFVFTEKILKDMCYKYYSEVEVFRYNDVIKEKGIMLPTILVRCKR